MLHTAFDATPGTEEAKLIRQSQGLYKVLAEQNGFKVKRNGAIMIAKNMSEVL